MIKDEIVKLLSKIVAISSVYPKEKPLIDFLYGYLRKRRVKVIKQKVKDNRYNLLAEKGKGEKAIIFLTHADTVKPVDGWETDPFSLVKKGDKLFGLGAWDMKGGLVVSLLNFLTFSPRSYQLKLAVCVDEENISLGGYKLAKSDFIKNVDCFVSLEPAFSYGPSGIVIGRSGRALYKLILKQPSFHTAFYTKKIDLGLVLAKIIDSLKKFYKKVGDDKKQFIHARKIETEVTGMSLVSKIRADLESIILPPLTHEEVLRQLKELIAKILKAFDKKISYKLDFAVRETPFLNPYQIKSNSFYLKLLKQSVKKNTKKKPKLYFRSSVADENIFGAMGKTILGIGPVGGNAHGACEWVSLSSLIQLTNIIQQFLIRLDQEYK